MKTTWSEKQRNFKKKKISMKKIISLKFFFFQLFPKTVGQHSKSILNMNWCLYVMWKGHLCRPSWFWAKSETLGPLFCVEKSKNLNFYFCTNRRYRKFFDAPRMTRRHFRVHWSTFSPILIGPCRWIITVVITWWKK